MKDEKKEKFTSDDGLSNIKNIYIIIGFVFGLFILISVIYFFYWKKQAKQSYNIISENILI